MRSLLELPRSSAQRSVASVADQSRLPEIVDAAAAVAAAYVPHVQGFYGIGSGLVTVPADGLPFFAGQLVTAWPGNTAQPGELVSFCSAATQVTKSRTVTHTTFQIELRYYVNRGDLAAATRDLTRIFQPMQTAFSQHTSLLGTVPSGHALNKGCRFVIPQGGNDAWILFTLEAVETLDLDNHG